MKNDFQDEPYMESEDFKEKVKEYYEIQNEIESEKSQELKVENKILFKKIKKKGKIPNIYTCQKCNKEFVTEKDLKIMLNKYPLCKFCIGGNNG